MARTTPVRRWLVLAAVVPMLAASACGNSGDDTSSSGSGSDTTASSNLPSKKATGDEVVIGFINVDSSPLGDFSDVSDAAESLADYVNNNLGGLGGHKVTIKTCASNGSDNSSASCATDLLGDDPVAIFGGLDTGSGGSVPLITGKGVPYIGTTPITSAELTTPGAFAFSAGIGGSFGAADLYLAKTLGAKKVGIITNDSATAKGVADGLGVALLKSLGSDGQVVTHALTETDLTAAWASASKGADAAMAIEPSTQCVAAMKARAAAASDIPLVMFGCSDDNTIKAAGSAAEGAYFGSGYDSPTADSEDAKTFQSVMETYAPKARRDSYTESIVSSLTTLSRILTDQTDLTAASALTAIQGAADVPGFLTPPLTCDGKQVPNLTAFCSGAGYVLQVKDGELVDVGDGPQNVFAQ